MSKEMIISVNGREKKIAIIEDDVVTEFYVERGDENQGIVGNIYKGRVMKVLPGMQSAFVDIGLERDSFLYVSDFFDEDMEDEEEEVRKEVARPQKIERPSRAREAARAAQAAEPEADEDQEMDLQVAALRHIEEITEEPVIEPAPDEEPLGVLSVKLPLIPLGLAEAEEEPPAEEKAAGRERGPRQRRKSRLRYAEPEAPEVVEEVPEVAEEEPSEEEAPAVEEAIVAEPEDLAGGRRRGRARGRGRGRGRGGDAGEPEIVEAERPKVAESEEMEEPSYVLVHHEPLERVIDDEDFTAGDMLKDAMMQERIAGWIHEEERVTSLLEVEPTPEVHVGSLRHALGQESGFERISDSEEAEEQAIEFAKAESSESEPFAHKPAREAGLAESATLEVATAAAAETEEDSTDGSHQAVAQSFEGVQFPLVEPAPGDSAEPGQAAPESEPREEHSLTHHVVEIGSDVELLHLNPPAADFEEGGPKSSGDTTEELTEEELPREELKDASAKIRQRPRRGEMATRRGGRGRRRTFRPRQGATDATVNEEDAHDEQEEVASSVPSLLTRSAERQPERLPERPMDRFQRPVISDLLREGQEIIVQIAKEPIGQKGARITSHVALPGRYIVYMPTVEHIGVSRKIGTDEERQRLRRTLHQLRAEAGAGGGFIVRTAANGCTTEELREDMQYLIRTWTDIRRRSERAKSPAIVHRDLDLVQRILRDQISSDYTAIRVDNEFEYERIVDFVNRFAPKLVHRVKLYTKDTPILEAYGVQPEIDKAVKPRVWLKSGGYIVINQTEALVAIDVNTGKFVGKSNRLEDTITKTNLEAAKEIVRQIRLRDLGGIIVLDFIDMEERRNRQKVMQALEQEIRSDRSPSKILQFNDFGLVAVTRKRVKQSLERTLCTPCHYCGGGGMIKSPQTICYEILAEARRISKDVEDHNEVILRVNPEVAKALRGVERDVLVEIEAYLGGIVTIKSDPAVHQEQFDIALA